MTSPRSLARRTRRRPRTIGQKIGVALAAVIVMLLTIAVVEYAITRPYAKAIETTEWKAVQDEEVIAAPLAPGPLLSIEGVIHEGIDVYFDNARLDSASLQLLKTLQFQPPANAQALAWRSTSADVTGHNTIDIETVSIQPDAKIHFALLDGRSNAVLSLKAERATIRITLGVAPAGRDMVNTAENKSLEWANGAQLHLTGSWPVTVEVPEGARVRFVFPTNAPQSFLYLGVMENQVARLAVREIGVKPAESNGFARYACAARPGQIWWRLGDPGGAACSSTPRLFVGKLTLAPDSLNVQLLSGGAWLAKDGQFERSEWYAWLEKNPVIRQLGEALIGAFVSWLLLTVTGIWGGKK